jgi:multicomponent K+:H+ antiporter subunit F
VNPLDYALPLAAAMLAMAMALNLWRSVRGPALADRLQALDTLYINALALLVLQGIHLGTRVYFEAALVIAVLGFIGTVALSRYVLRRDIIE